MASSDVARSLLDEEGLPTLKWLLLARVPQKSLTLETFLAGHGMIVGSDDNDGDLVLSLTNTKTIRQQHCLEVASLAIAAGGAIKASHTTTLMTGAEFLGAMNKSEAVARGYKAAR